MKNENYYLEILVEELPLSTKASNLLRENGLETVEMIIDAGWDKLRRIHNMGPKTLLEINNMVEGLTDRKDAIRSGNSQDLKCGMR